MVIPKVHSSAKTFPFPSIGKWKQSLEGETLPKGLVFIAGQALRSVKSVTSVLCVFLVLHAEALTLEMLHISVLYTLCNERNKSSF